MIRYSVVRLLSSHLCKSIYDVGGVFHRVIPRGGGGDRHRHAVNLNNRLLPIRCLTDNIHQTDPNSSQPSDSDIDSKCWDTFQFWSKKFCKTYSSEEDKLQDFKWFKKCATPYLLIDDPNKRLKHFLDNGTDDCSPVHPFVTPLLSSHSPLPMSYFRRRYSPKEKPSNEGYVLKWYELFQFWCKKYGKTYSSEEDKLHRYKLFMECALKCGQRYVIDFNKEDPDKRLMCFLDSHSADDLTNDCSPLHSLSTLLLSRDNHETNPHSCVIKEPWDSDAELFRLFNLWNKNYGEVYYLYNYDDQLPGLSFDETKTNNPGNEYFLEYFPAHPLSKSTFSRDDDETIPISFKMMESSNVVLNFFEVFELWNLEYNKTYSSNHFKLDHFFYLFKLWHKEEEYLKAEED